MIKNIQLKNKKTCQTQKVSAQPVWYAESLTKSLVLFAQSNKEFARELKRTILDLRFIGIGNRVKIDKEIGILMPISFDDAMRRSRWLIQGISNGSLPGAKNAANVLTSWVSDCPIETPKQLVVGVLAIAIPGVTLGLFPKSKRMSFVIRRELALKKDLKLAKKITQLSHEILISSLDLAQGDIRRLEPEISDWFFGDKKISIYRASGQKMKEIKEDLSGQGIIFASSQQGSELDILAISPSVDSSVSETFWDLDKAEE